MQKEAFEPTGLIPRSIIRTFDRFLQQLLPGKEKIAIQEYRVSRYQILVSIKSLLILVATPVIVNWTLKAVLLTPLTEHFWNENQGEIFLNQYQEKRAFAEMQDFTEKIFFELLCEESSELWTTDFNSQRLGLDTQQEKENLTSLVSRKVPFLPTKESNNLYKKDDLPKIYGTKALQNLPDFLESDYNPSSSLKETDLLATISQTQFQAKSLELAKSYNKQSILAITNLLGDVVTFLTVCSLFKIMQPEIIILKSFLTESVYSLSDTTKSFLLILGMDLLVGFHSPRGWEIVLEGLLRHIGLPENENFVLLFVALFPVFLDTVFKYWIFRYLNKISPSTVVTYHSMIE